MANFPDDELLLGSSIFLKERLNQQQQLHHVHHHHLSYMDDLTQHFTALSLLQQTQLPKPRLSLPNNAFKTPLRNGPVAVTPPVPSYFSGASVERSFSGGNKPVQFLKPSVESYLQLQQRNTNRRQNRLLVQQNRNLAYQGSGFVVRESGGTGVFHPRVNIITNRDTIRDKTAAKKKQSVRDYRQEMEVSEEERKRVGVSVSKKEECYYHLPPELGLPSDWTY